MAGLTGGGGQGQQGPSPVESSPIPSQADVLSGIVANRLMNTLPQSPQIAEDMPLPAPRMSDQEFAYQHGIPPALQQLIGSGFTGWGDVDAEGQPYNLHPSSDKTFGSNGLGYSPSPGNFQIGLPSLVSGSQVQQAQGRPPIFSIIAILKAMGL